MPTLPIPFSTGQASGLEQLGGAPPLVVNLLPDATGTVRTRPGVAAWTDWLADDGAIVPASSAVIGIFPWGADKLVYVTEDRAIYCWTGPGSIISLSTSDVLTQLDGVARPTFTYDHAGCYLAGGGALQTWDGVSATSQRLTGVLPGVQYTHIAAMALRLFASQNGTSGMTDFTNVNDPTSWATGNEFEAEARPDPVVAVHDNTNELFAFGTRTTQAYAPDPTTKIAVSRTMSVGCGAPYSVIPMDTAFAWLDDRRRFIISDTRQIEPISTPAMDGVIAGLTTTSDCWGFRAKLASYDLLVWLFPTEKRGFCYEAGTKTWMDWRTWSGGAWAAPYITAHAYWPEKNLHLVGNATGQIGLLSLDVTTEGNDLLTIEGITGFSNRDTPLRKQNLRVTGIVKRGIGADLSPTVPAAPEFQLSWRDDLGAFCQPLRRSLGVVGDNSATVEYRNLGIYETRQWRVTATCPYPLVISQLLETLEVLEV